LIIKEFVVINIANVRKIALLLVVLAGSIPYVFGQDIHQSQFYTSPLNLNPALTGNFFGDSRITANYRNQWFVDNLANYLTFTASFDHRFYPKSWKQKGIWSAGMIINYDQAGESKLGLSNLGLSVSYAYAVNSKNVIALGALLGGTSRKFDANRLTWDSQWNGRSFDPNLPSGESASPTSNFFMDLSAGLNYRWQKSRRTKLDAGIGAFHLNRPDQVFYTQNTSQKLENRFSFYITPSLKLTSKIDLLIHGLFQTQKPYKESVAGLYGKFYINTKRGKELALYLGGAVRPGDALIPKIAVEYKNWYAGASYDINTSPFKVATKRNGGPEISLTYVFVKARPLEQIKACPIF